jgi:glycosyltransferase involved in cell wall biosynthesis
MERIPAMTTMHQSAASGRSDDVHVLHIGPDIKGPGGMPAVIRTLMASPLAERYGFAFLRTYGSASNFKRLMTFGGGLFGLVVWCCRPGDRVVHVHTATRGSWYRKAIAVTVVKALGRPVVLHFHAGEGDIKAFEQRLGRVRLRLVRWAFAKSDSVIAVSAAGAAEVKRIFSFDAVGVVPNAAPSVDAATRPRQQEPARPRIVYLGGFANPAKGSDVLLDALAAVAAVQPDLDVLLAGPGEPPAAAAALMRSAKVRWAGYLLEEPKVAALREAQIFVMPSVSEGMPVALLEAMAHGLAIVATRVGGIPEVVEHGVDALLVEPHDSAALALALRELLADPVLRDRLGRAARGRAARLNETQVFEQLEAVYRKTRHPGRVREGVSTAAYAA